ncbi:patatin-like phospholipase family protein [Roseovarius sp. S4756]|uniref:patatin-like phospholipase family protein n=1 Tax=Roseovarius maritimus TaxID=3342637 RepID=UPI0037273948
MRRRGFIAGALALGACTGSPPEIRKVKEPLLPHLRISGDAPFETWRSHLDLGRMRSRPNVLALSGGGEDGAFGAGVLVGWSETGTRPQFDVVTGVSTGALMAPFAFLGPQYDSELRRIYTTYGQDDLIAYRGLGGILSGGLVSSAPMAGLIERHLPDNVLRQIAAEWRAGRRMFVVTSNIDTGRAMIWDMGAIADEGQYGLFRAVILASASIPGLFPPVTLHMAGGIESHVDGAVHMQFLAVPEAAFGNLGDSPGRGGALWILVNNMLRPPPAAVSRTPIAIMMNTFNTAVRASAAQSVGIAERYAERTGMRFAVATIGPDFDVAWDPTERFSLKYMRPLFEYGRKRALRGAAWRS